MGRERWTNLAHSIDEWVLVENVHGSCLEERAGSLDPNTGSLHLTTGGLNHLDAISYVAPKGDECAMHWGLMGVHAGVEQRLSAS